MTGLSPEADRLSEAELNIMFHFAPVLASYELPLEWKFLALAQRWKRDTMFASAIPIVVSHPAYRQIIELGSEAIPLILQDLARESALWFDALTAITGAQPILPEHYGDIDAMRDDWLRWGVENGSFPERSHCSTAD